MYQSDEGVEEEQSIEASEFEGQEHPSDEINR